MGSVPLDKTLDEIIQGQAKTRKTGETRKASAGQSVNHAALRESLSQKGREGPYSLYPPNQGGATSSRRRKARTKRAAPPEADVAQAAWQAQGRFPGQGLNGATLVGWVVSFSARSGWGFLECEEIRSRDVFIHLSDCDDSVGQLQVGDEVEFELAHTAEGNPRAMFGRVLEPADWQAQLEEATPLGTPRGGRQNARSDILDEPASARGRGRGKAVSAADSGQRGAGARVPPAAGGAGARVRVLNVPWTLTGQQLSEAFEELGDVLRVDLDETRVGQAVVTFRSPAAARRAVEEYHRGKINGREILVRYED